MTKKYLIEIMGWFGLVLLTCATLPVTLRVITNPNAIQPPLDMVILLFFGLLLLFIRAIKAKDYLYIISNGLSSICYLTLLVLILT